MVEKTARSAILNELCQSNEVALAYELSAFKGRYELFATRIWIMVCRPYVKMCRFRDGIELLKLLNVMY